MAMSKLNENVHADQNPFRTAFFKSMFSFREKWIMPMLNIFSTFQHLSHYVDTFKMTKGLAKPLK